MCAFKKPSTPSFGVKLFVSLVLLAISLCLVNCTAATSDTTVPTGEAKLSISKTEVANKLTELVGPKGKNTFSKHNPGYDVKDAFPTGAVAGVPLKPKYIDPAAADPSGTSAATPAKFEVLLPVDKTIDEYIAEVVKPLSGMGDKDSAKVDEKLKKQLEKNAHELVPSVTSSKFFVEKNFKDLGVILAKNFEFNTSSLLQKKEPTSSGTPVTDADKILFEFVFSGDFKPKDSFDPIVYIDANAYSNANELVTKCAAEVNVAAATAAAAAGSGGSAVATGTAPRFSKVEEAIKIFLNCLLGKLQPSGTSGTTEIKWSDVDAAIRTFGFKKEDVIESGVTTTFEQSMIVVANVTSPEKYYEKFYLKVELNKLGTVSDEERLITYLNVNIYQHATGKDAFPALVKNTFGTSLVPENQFYNPVIPPTGVNGFHYVASADISKLKNEIDKALGDYSLLTFEATDIVPATGPFIVVTDNLECAKFPVKHVTPIATATIDNFVDYVKYILSKFTSTGDDATIKKEFLALLWKPESLETYKTSLATPVKAPTPPVSSTTTTGVTGANSGGESGDKNATQSGEKQESQNKDTSGSTESKSDYMWIVWTSVSIVGTAIAGVVGYFFWNRKKASNL